MLIFRMGLQAILLLLIPGAIDFARSQCPVKIETTISDTSGRITKSAMRNGENCDQSWIFPNIPNKMVMLVLNMTTAPMYNDVIKLNGDDFVDDDKFKYCKVLEMDTRTLEGSLKTLERIHKEFPGCKLRSGVRPGVTLTYDAKEGSFGSTNFVIEYRTLRPFSDPQPTTKAVETRKTSASSTDTQPTAKSVKTPAAPATTVALKNIQTSGVMTNITIKATQDGNLVFLTSKLPIILGSLGGIVVVLLILLTVVLTVRKRRTRSNITKDDNQPSDNQLGSFYQAIPENSSNGDTNGQIYDEISSTRTSRKHTGDKTQYGGNVTRQKSAKDVINPLYEAQVPDKHSYEYIEVRIPQIREREDRSAL